MPSGAQRIDAMKIFLFARDGAGDHIRNAVIRTVPETEVYSSMDSLAGRIMSQPKGAAFAFLIAGSKRELEEMHLMKWLLHGIGTILILPDGDADTVAAGYELRPRFMGCLHDDGDEIAAVLSRMLAREGWGKSAVVPDGSKRSDAGTGS